jgi:hypothetical protein
MSQVSSEYSYAVLRVSTLGIVAPHLGPSPAWWLVNIFFLCTKAAKLFCIQLQVETAIKIIIEQKQ